MILTVTANASIDKRYVMGALRAGEVNRVKECTMTAGGKGLNVAHTVKTAGHETLATGFLGGHHGRFIQEALQKDGIRESFVWCGGETRSCVNIWDEEKKQQTELLEPGLTVTKENISELIAVYTSLLEECDVAAISGSLPGGADAELYRTLIGIARSAGKPAVLDTAGKTLRECLSARPYMIKPNAQELEQLTGAKGKEEILSAAGELHGNGIEIVIVSLGSEGALMVCGSGCYEAKVPRIEAVNTVGCGDAMTGGFCVGLERGLEAPECLRLASAVSAAAAMTDRTGFFIPEDMEEIYKKTEIRKLR